MFSITLCSGKDHLVSAFIGYIGLWHALVGIAPWKLVRLPAALALNCQSNTVEVNGHPED